MCRKISTPIIALSIFIITLIGGGITPVEADVIGIGTQDDPYLILLRMDYILLVIGVSMAIVEI